MADEKEKGGRTIRFGEMSMRERFKWAGKAIFGFTETGFAGHIPSREEDFGFRRITQRSDKELKPADWQKQLSVAHFLWLQNPMAGRILELMADFVVGDGFAFKAKDEEVDKTLSRHWDDPDNDWDLLQFDRYQELMLFGTWAPRAFVSEHNGHVKLGPIDPSWIAEIFPSPDIAGKAIALRIEPRHEGGDYEARDDEKKKKNTFKVISAETLAFIEDPEHPGEQIANPNYGLLTGEIFYFTVNKLTFLLQGISDLFRVADWVDAFDQFVFSLLERINFLNAHLYDITLTGAEQAEVNERAAYIADNPPRPGSSRVHNENEKWEALAPKINSAEVEEVAKIIKALILGSMGIPLHWFADGGDVNRATAAEMGGPIHRKLKRKQAQWAAIIRSILQFVIDQAISHGRLSKVYPEGSVDANGASNAGQPRDLSFEILKPEITSKGLVEFIDGLDKLTSALSGAIAEGFISQAKAAGVWTSVAQELGVEIEAPDEKEVAANTAEKDAATKAKVDANAEEAITPEEKPKGFTGGIDATKVKMAPSPEPGAVADGK